MNSYHRDLAESFRMDESVYNTQFRKNIEREILTGTENTKNVLRRLACERNIFETYKTADDTLDFAYFMGRRKYISRANICEFLVEYQKKYERLAREASDPVQAIKWVGVAEHYKGLFDAYAALENAPHLFGPDTEGAEAISWPTL